MNASPISKGKSKSNGKWLAALCWLALLICVPYYTYVKADSSGWIRHSKITPVLLSASEWMVGEYRDCTVSWIGIDGKIEALRCPVDAPLYADARNEHDLPVRYWGKIVRTDIEIQNTLADGEAKMAADLGHAPTILPKPWNWRCQRRTDDVVCWAEN